MASYATADLPASHSAMCGGRAPVSERRICIIMMLAWLMFTAAGLAQQADAQFPSDTAACAFEDGKQLSVRYNRPIASDKEKLPIGKVWEPGDSPMFLFTETELTVGNATVPVGAFSMYAIPGKQDWTLVINKNVTAGAPYDQQQDIVRAPMETGQLSQPEKKFTVYFGRTGPKQCSMRLDFGKTRAWIELNEK